MTMVNSRSTGHTHSKGSVLEHTLNGITEALERGLITKDQFDWDWDTSEDGGKTWSIWYNQPVGQLYHVSTENITNLRKAVASSLSGGERRRLEIARSLVSNPQIILLDEPFTGIDPVTIDSIQEIIRRLSDDGIAILVTDHQVRETLQITDRTYLIRKGQVFCHGSREEVLSNADARKYYFGENMDLGAA